MIDQVKGLKDEPVTTSATNTIIYPICTNANNERSWDNDFNQTIRFGESSLNLNVYENPIETAYLKMFKIPVEDGLDVALNICNKQFYSRQIRVTVSIYVTPQSNSRKQREGKKVICSTTMLPYTYEGWIEMDIKRAIYIWKTTNSNANNDFRIFLEVHDEESAPLKAGNFFIPMRCLNRSNNLNVKRYTVSIQKGFPVG